MGCSLWLDAADTRTLTTNGSGNVTQWADKSSTGATMTPIGTQSNATLQANYQNGLTAVNFSGLNMYRSPTNTGVYPSDVYILVALKSLVRMDVIAIGSTGVDNFNSLTFGEHTALRWHNGSSGFARTPLTVAPTNETSTSLLLMNWSIANNNFVIRRNGTQLSSTASYTYTLTAPSAIQIGFRHTDRTNSDLNLNAYIAEIVTYNRQLTLRERQQVEGYLAWKWGLSSSLPTSHAYKSNPPAMRLFQPSDIPNCAIWVDPADRSTVTGLSGNQPTAIQSKGHQAITLDNLTPQVNTAGPGSPWTGWPPSGVTNYGTSFMNTTSSNLNTLQFTRTVGSGGVYGNGYNGSYLRIPSITFSNQQRTMFWVHSAQSTGIDDFAHVFAPTNFSGLRQRGYHYYLGTAYVMFPVSTAGGSQTLVIGGTAPYNGTMPTDGTPFIFGGRHTTSTASNYMSINGSNLTPSTNQALTTGYTTETNEYVIGIFYAYTRQFLMGDFILYDGAILDSEIRQLEGYLAWKWGLRTSLPTTHPYYTFPPATPLFTPTLMSNCVFWIDAADRTTVTSNASSVVTAVTDKSPSGSNITNAMTTSGFTWNITKFNTDYPSFYYNSTQNITLGSNSSLTISQPATVFTVQQLVGSASFQDVFDSTNSGNRMFAFYFVSGTANYRIFAGTTLSPATNAVTTPAIYSYYFNGASSQIFENGTSTVTGDAGAQGSTGITIGSRWTQNQETFQGHIAEVIYYNRRLSQSERQTVEGYLAWKWGLRNNLPTNHPYYRFRP